MTYAYWEGLCAAWIITFFSFVLFRILLMVSEFSLFSGPRCGLGELILPENEPGSSIMPVKFSFQFPII